MGHTGFTKMAPKTIRTLQPNVIEIILFHLHGQLCPTCNTCVFAGVDTCVQYVYYTCISYICITPVVLHM